MARTEGTGLAAGAASDQPSPRRLRSVLPKSALGLAGVLFLMSVAAAFVGAILYAYYSYRLGETEDRVDAFAASFEAAISGAIDEIGTERDRAVGAVQSQLEDLEKFAASGETLAQLLEQAAPSVYFVTTLDEAGQPAVGSAFVVFADSERSFLLTSFETIRAATQNPAPPVAVRKGDEVIEDVELLTWDEPNDLALLSVGRPSLPPLRWAPTDPPMQVGDRVFVVSGLGAAGGSISQGFVADLSANGVQHDAPVGTHFQGGPVLNSQGEVVAVASRAYAPLGFRPEAVFFGVPIRTSCAQVLQCPAEGQPG